MTRSLAEAVFVDTSAILPILHRSDHDHHRCHLSMEELRLERAPLITSSYVIHESIALLQARFGLEAVRQFEWAFMPVLQVVWVDGLLHARGMASLLGAQRRGVSLTDWVSFKVMEDRGIHRSLALDHHFVEQGFKLV